MLAFAMLYIKNYIRIYIIWKAMPLIIKEKPKKIRK